jgi:ATP-binding cassette subfamily B protein/subfamily B ATP-binding cassette protein MsbA
LAAIADPVRKLSNVYTRLQSGVAASDRIFSYVDQKPRIQANTDGPRLARHQHSIEFRNVCFSYEPNRDRDTLFGINLYVKHGETIALVGMNGCGKSTLVSLLPRFYDPDHGTIFIDGINIRELHLRSLRQQIGLVTQDSFFFDDTIFNNISYGNRRATREDVEEAAKRAFIHDYISQLPEGYDTRVGEASFVKLSGGQKQRIALARAMLRDPSILILDEFTSQTDTVSESDIHRVLREFMRNRTTFVITHRLNTLEIADRIVVLEKGCIEAVGTHAELLNNCQVYHSLYEAHFQRKAA